MAAELSSLRAERDALRASLQASEHALAEASRAAAAAERRLRLAQQQAGAHQDQSATALIWRALFGDSSAPGLSEAAAAACYPGVSVSAVSAGMSVEEIVQPVRRHLAVVSAERDRLESELARRGGGSAAGWVDHVNTPLLAPRGETSLRAGRDARMTLPAAAALTKGQGGEGGALPLPRRCARPVFGAGARARRRATSPRGRRQPPRALSFSSYPHDAAPVSEKRRR